MSRHNILFVFVIMLLLSSCMPNPTVAIPIVGSATIVPPPPSPTEEVLGTDVIPTEVEAVEMPTVTFEPSIAGGDFLAIAVDDLGDGWQRIVTAGNRDNCAWSNQFRFDMSAGIAAQVPHCWELRMIGTGTVKFEVKPDEVGYDTSDTLQTGLAFWPSGNNGQYRVSRDSGQSWTEWIELTTGPEGVDFPKNSSAIIIEFKLDNGYMAMPLGEIRNNVLPQY